MKCGNLVIVGHNYKNGQFFGNLKNLVKGDNIFLFSSKGNAQIYKVYDKYVTNETDMSCTKQETNGQIEWTLITCCDNADTKRLIINARLSD